MDGVLRCSKYAFGPNRLHYCGPDANREIYDYINDGATDPGLEAFLKGFQTMFPYLRHIAHANNIADPFDERVVEAYWLGNELLDTIEKKVFWRHLIDDHQIPKKIGKKSFSYIEQKIERGATPNHSFHVLNIWKRTGHKDEPHTLESMDSCRISWGKVKNIDGQTITIEREPLVMRAGKLALGTPEVVKITRGLECDIAIDELRVGNIVSVHWGIPCEVITQKQAFALRRFTLRHIALANETI